MRSGCAQHHQQQRHARSYDDGDTDDDRLHRQINSCHRPRIGAHHQNKTHMMVFGLGEALARNALPQISMHVRKSVGSQSGSRPRCRCCCCCCYRRAATHSLTHSLTYPLHRTADAQPYSDTYQAGYLHWCNTNGDTRAERTSLTPVRRSAAVPGVSGGSLACLVLFLCLRVGICAPCSFTCFDFDIF
ncbi:hypothetical protein JOL62DRAFT_584529 [Phyllosticta paracitricarpa]|uniref:Uncharacterized protein n=1 Tax=Phyllosticta paracitricarpa TaxID=2016321 RepID=A0ABR1MWK5_9PEZI